jgi:hypothetical protein
MKTTVIHHSADHDGIFCREIARKFLPDAELIGWDFKDSPLSVPNEGGIYVLDLPVDRVFGLDFKKTDWNQAIPNCIFWIDHHKSSIDSHPPHIPGYRIDGVAACRLAWQFFTHRHNEPNMSLPTRQAYLDRSVTEPLAVRLAGEYDIWDHRGDGDVEFQFGLDVQENIDWRWLLDCDHDDNVWYIIEHGRSAMRCYAKRDADIMRERSFVTEFEGLKFLTLNTARCNSNSFAAKDIPETGHDALLAFYYNGIKWTVSLYHAKHNTGIDLSQIAVKYGGGGHRGACGFQCGELPFI